MSQSRSPSGVASLRARFEQSQSDNSKTSPPSRGRSPAGSVTSEHNRPLSRIRTNFVSVEPSGQMSSNLQVPTVTSDQVDGTQETRDGKAEDGPKKESKVNGVKMQIQDEKVKSSNGPQKNHDLPSEPPQDQSDAPGGASEAPVGLGTILKGSPFEETGTEKRTGSQTAAPKKAQSPNVATKQPPLSKASTRPPPAKETLKPEKVAQSIQSNARPVQSQKAELPNAGPLSNGKSPHPSKADSLGTKKETQKSTQPKQREPSIKSPATAQFPKTEKAEKAPTKAPASGANSIAQKGSRTTDSQPKKAALKAADALKTTTKSSTAAAKAAVSKPSQSKLSQAAPSQKSSSSSTGFSKPRPKSPTKPVKLPSSATAATASSAAKHDADASHGTSRSPSRQSNNPSATSNHRASLSKTARPARASLPAHSKPHDRPKSKPRTSLAPGAGTSGSFLERMMRPTQSSAQKIHEKVEPTSPPRHNNQSTSHGTNRKRESGDSVGSVSDKQEAVSAAPAPQSAPLAADDPKHLQPMPLSDGASTQSNEVAREVESAAPAVLTES